MSLFDPMFWRHAWGAIARTALAALVPFLPGLWTNLADTWLLAAATVALVVIVAIANSLKGTVDPDGAPWALVLLARGLRQFGQYIVGGTVGAVLLWDVDWRTLLLSAAASATSTVVLAAITLLPQDAGDSLPKRALVLREPIVIEGKVADHG